jgi:hypothetical protein
MSNYLGWYPRRRGILEHLDKGSISLLDLAVHDFLCLTADYRTGVAWSSSEKIHALCPAEINSRAIRRSLAKMEGLGWLKRFCVRGRRGNYAVVIARYFVRDASGNWMSVNAERTTDWRNVQFDHVHDPSFLLSEPDREPVGEPVGELSGIKEVRREETKNKKENPQSAEALLAQPVKKDFENRKILTSRSEKIKQVYFEEFEKRFHVIPDFDGSDGKELARFVKRRTEEVDVLVAWLKNAFDSDDVPATWIRFRLREWCGRASKFSDGPLRKKKSINVRLENQDPTKFDGVIV